MIKRPSKLAGEVVLATVKEIVDHWQRDLGTTFKVVLGGSLAEGLFVMNEETTFIGVYVCFLAYGRDPGHPRTWGIVSNTTNLAYYGEEQTVSDWPCGRSKAIKLSGLLSPRPGAPYPLLVRGRVRNAQYVNWADYYRLVFDEGELEKLRAQKAAIGRAGPGYEIFKAAVRQEVKTRVLARGLLQIPEPDLADVRSASAPAFDLTESLCVAE